MDHTQELQKALQELRRITGIGLDVQAESEEETEQAADPVPVHSV
jgi:hypothetical protein